MGLFLQSLLVTLTLGVVATLTGRAVCCLLGLNWLRRRSAENFALAAFVGTALLVLVFGWCSYRGLTAPRAARVIGIGLAALLVALAARRRLSWLLPQRRRGDLLPGGAAVLSVVLVLYPLAAVGSFWLLSDCGTYVAISEWLQRHPFSEKVTYDPSYPALAEIIGYQTACLRMGTQFLMALCQAVSGLPGLEIFLPVAAWGVALNVGGIFLLCRWALRLRRPLALAGAAVAAVTFNPVHFSAGGGYLPQTFGTAALAVTLAVLARLQSPPRWSAGAAVVLGLLGASLVSLYSEMAPILAAGGLAYVGWAGWRAWRRRRVGRFLGFAGLTVLALAVLGNVEYQRALFAVRVQMKTYDVVRVEWPLLQFWGFALGAWAYPPTALPVGTLAALFCTGLATLCFFLGLGRLVRSRQALPLAACVGLLLAMGLYYAFVARDPWDGRMGHSWRVWKSSKWIFPLAAAVEAAGLGVLVRRARAPRLIPGLAFGLALTLSLPLHQQSAAIVRSNQLTLLGCEHFVTTWRGFCHDMDARGRRAVCLVRSPQERLYSDLFTRFYYPRPVRDLGEPVPPGAPPPAMPAGALVLAWGDVPDESVREQLLAGVRALDSSCPAVFRIINPNGMDHAAGGEQYTWLGALPARLEVWAPRAGKARLEFLAGAGPGLPGKLHRRLELTLPGGVKRAVEFEGATETSVALELPAGMTFVEVRCDGAPGGARHPLSDPRLMVAWMSRIRVVPEGTGDHRHEPAARAR